MGSLFQESVRRRDRGCFRFRGISRYYVLLHSCLHPIFVSAAYFKYLRQYTRLSSLHNCTMKESFVQGRPSASFQRKTKKSRSEMRALLCNSTTCTEQNLTSKCSTLFTIAAIKTAALPGTLHAIIRERHIFCQNKTTRKVPMRASS